MNILVVSSSRVHSTGIIEETPIQIYIHACRPLWIKLQIM